MQLLGSTELDPSSKPQKESYSYQLPEMKSKSALNEAVAGVELGFDLYFLEGPWALALALSFFTLTMASLLAREPCWVID